MFKIPELKNPTKFFIYFIIGLITTNYLGSILISAYFFHGTAKTLTYIQLLSQVNFSYFLAIMWPLTFAKIVMIPTQYPMSMIVSFLILSIISIPLTIKFSKGVKIYKRIIFAYLIYLNILVMFAIWWIPKMPTGFT